MLYRCVLPLGKYEINDLSQGPSHTPLVNSITRLEELLSVKQGIRVIVASVPNLTLTLMVDTDGQMASGRH